MGISTAQAIDQKTNHYYSELINKSRFRNLKGAAWDAKVAEMDKELNIRVLDAWVDALSPVDGTTLSILRLDPKKYPNNELIAFIMEHTPNRGAITSWVMAEYEAEFLRR